MRRSPDCPRIIARQTADISPRGKSALDGWAVGKHDQCGEGVTDSEVEVAARYFASMKAKARYTVVERATFRS